MPLPPRFTYHHHSVTGRWYVYDRLLDRRIRIEGLGVMAADIARDYEANWRRQCERWQQAEHRDRLP